ncbi:MAG: hypothetical protein J5612_06010 [Paludibacteraceae bacterium]|nr:hypothetical protein [Paludibacteraceae bacterium]
MKKIRDIAGYVLGGVLFVGLLPLIMWLASGMPNMAVHIGAWQAALVWGIFFVIMFVQVLTEEKRLREDFGEEYEAYCKRTRRF